MVYKTTDIQQGVTTQGMIQLQLANDRSNSALSAMAKAKSWPHAVEYLATGPARAQHQEAFEHHWLMVENWG